MTSDILKRAAEVSARARVYSIIAGDRAINLGELLTDMAAAIAERDAEIERLTARAEAAEAMADRLAEALKNTSDAHMSLAHDSYDGCWTIEDFDSESAVATEALAAYAAMKEGTSTLSPIAAAARVLLADDVAISRMAEAIHDGPLGAEGHWFSAATEQGGWCVDVVRAGLRALAEQEKADG